MTDWQHITNKLYRFFAARCQHQDAMDLTQEALRRTIAKWQAGSILSERGTIEQFAYGVALNIAREFSKRRSLHLLEPEQIEELHNDDAIPSMEQRLTLSRQSQQLRQAIAKLSPSEAEIICLLIDQDLELSRIAEILDVPIGTVKSHISRAKNKLIALLNPGVSNGPR